MTVRGMNKTRATAMEWSAALPLEGIVGLDGSVLAIGTRAGAIDMWACSPVGPDKEFERIATMDLPKPWASEIVWSKWTAVSDTECEFNKLQLELTNRHRKNRGRDYRWSHLPPARYPPRCCRRGNVRH